MLRTLARIRPGFQGCSLNPDPFELAQALGETAARCLGFEGSVQSADGKTSKRKKQRITIRCLGVTSLADMRRVVVMEIRGERQSDKTRNTTPASIAMAMMPWDGDGDLARPEVRKFSVGRLSSRLHVA